MSMNEGRLNKDQTKMMTLGLITIGLVLILVVPLLGILIMSGDEENHGDVAYQDQIGAATGDSSMDDATQEAWEDFLSTAPSIEVRTNAFDTDVKDRELELLGSLPSEVDDDTNYNPPTTAGGGDYDAQDDGAMEASDDDDDDRNGADDKGSGDREVEEADIVKAVDDRIFVLNNYMGFLSVNMEDPSGPYIEGRAPVLGTPVSMYIVDFLGFVIVSNAPSLDGEGQGSMGRLYILDLTDTTDPRIVDTTDLNGYPIDSRRVGEVIYIISNEYDYYYGGWGWGGMEIDVAVGVRDAVDDDDTSVSAEEGGPKTTIVSIGFYDPESLGEVDREVIDGDSGKIHASKFAIFIPQDEGDWEEPRTEFTYVDISDPKGEINVRGKITISGYLRDRFQMDHYRGMFRVVTQENPSWDREEDRFPASTLYIVDARDPDDMEIIANLPIDDEGNLMATRFAGDRAYTIHLPESIDPLDVLDLSVPDDPRLTDILEIPGWVEHMEVIGYNIIAIGVDNENERKVALYLFDVTDPENAELTDRVVIGDGYTYSEANWDEKALTILMDEQVVVVPYSSYDWQWYTGAENGVQLISYDLDEGTLEVRGSITGTSPIKRSRSVNGNLVTTSDRVLQSIDFDDLDEPKVEAVLDLSSNVVDAFIHDDKLVSVITPEWGESGAKVRISNINTPYDAIAEFGPVGLQYEGVKRDGNTVFIKGIRQGPDVEGGPYWEVHAYDMTDPLSPVTREVAKMEVPDSYLNEYNYKYLETDLMEDDDSERVTGAEDPIPYVTYDPFTWELLEGNTVVAYISYGYYGYRYYDEYWVPVESEEEPQDRIFMFRWDGSESVERRNIELGQRVNINTLIGGWDSLLIQSYNYGYGSELMKVYYYRGVQIINDNISVMGRLIGASGNMDLVYTAFDYWWGGMTHNTLNVYDISSGSAEYVMGVDLNHSYNQVKFLGDKVVVVSQDWGYTYGYGYPEDDVVYDEEGDPDEGVSTGSSGSSEKDALPPGEKEEWTEPEYRTMIHVFGIEDGVFETHKTYTVEGVYYNTLILENGILLHKDFTLMGVTFEDGGLTEIGPWPLHGYLTNGEIDDDMIVVAMGMYGIDTLDL